MVGNKLSLADIILYYGLHRYLVSISNHCSFQRLSLDAISLFTRYLSSMLKLMLLMLFSFGRRE